MTFILNARYFLVTYPQCDGLDEWAVNDHFGSLGAECIVAREDHADGGTHLHVFCDFGRKFRSRRADIFDVEGFHPNIERSKKNPRKGAAYATKDGDVVAGGLAIPQLPTRLVSGAQDPGSTLVCAESQREFFDVAEDICPWDLITKFGSFYQFARWKWPELGESYESPPGFSLADGAFPELVRYRTEVMGNRGKCSPPLRVPLGNHGGDFRGPAAALSPFGTHAKPGLIVCRSWKSKNPVRIRGVPHR